MTVDEPRPWPLEPLLAHAGSLGALAELVGVSGATVSVANRDGCTDRQADLWALRCGLHPCLVWPDWFEAAS